MSSTAIQSGISQAAFDAFLAARDEPAWLREKRVAAWRRFGELPMPGRNDEEWMRTDIRLFKLERFSLPAGGGPEGELPGHALMEGVTFAGYTAALDSRPLATEFSGAFTSPANRKGVLFGSLDEAVRSHRDLLRPHLFRAVDPVADKFAALHAACWSGGTVLYVPRGVVVEQPFHMLSAIRPGGVDFGH